METYHILSTGRGNARFAEQGSRSRESTRRDFGRMLFKVIPSWLIGDFADAVADELRFGHKRMRGAFDATIREWCRKIACQPENGEWIPKVGDEVYHKTFRSITRIDRVRAVRKAGELGFIYHTKDYSSWYTQAKLEEDYLPIEEDCDGD